MSAYIKFFCYCCLFFFVTGKVQAQLFKPTVYPDRIILTWAEDPTTTQSVTWRTDTSIVTGWAEITEEMSAPGLEPPKARRLQATTNSLMEKEYAAAHYHRVTFRDLKPNTLYAYRVGSDTLWSEWFQFRTAPAKEEAFSFIYLGDAQNDIKSKWSRVIRKAFATEGDARFIVHAGDLINRSNNDEQWGEWHFGGGFINGMIPSVPTPGNHEYKRDEQQMLRLDPHWKAQYTLPTNGPEGMQESVYYVDYANVRLISLNSQMIVLDSLARRKQFDWLEQVLKNNPQRWTFLTFHHPIYSTAKGRDNKEFRELFQPLFEKYHVDILMQGHDHTYGRGRNLPVGKSKKSAGGPMYLVSVAGPKMYEMGSDNQWADKLASHTQLFQIIHVDHDRLIYKAYKASGELFDTFELKKSSRNQPATYIERMHPD